MSPSQTRAMRTALALLGALFVVNALPRYGRFSGDAVIHLSISERAAAGGWFEFNPGEVASGSTSFAWTLLESTLIRLGGMSLLLWVIPAVLLAALLGCGALVRHLARTAGASPLSAALAGVTFVAIPAVTYNALLGMENIVHTCAALGALALWVAPGSPARDVALGAVIGVAAMLRPEGVLLGALPLLDLRAPSGLARLLRVSLSALLVFAPSVVVHATATGHLVPGSGVSRLMAVRRESLSFHLAGPVWLYLTAVSRFVVYLPITLLALLGARSTPDEAQSRRVRRGALTLFALGLGLYTVGTGAAHVGRLTQWLFALLCTQLGVGVDAALRAPSPWSRRGLVALAALHALLCAGETAARMRDLSQRHGGWDRGQVLAHMARRPAATTRALSLFCADGCCRAGTPPTVAMVEAQLRFDYDARIRIASLDGRTSSARGPGALQFDARACPVLEPALTAPEVVAVMEPPLAQLPRCGANSPTARALTTSWGGTAAVPGWRWQPTLPGWTRICP
ncbi:MAG: hypothetical protein U0325_36780, partial [Polyangiales bacterium]